MKHYNTNHLSAFVIGMVLQHIGSKSIDSRTTSAMFSDTFEQVERYLNNELQATDLWNRDYQLAIALEAEKLFGRAAIVQSDIRYVVYENGVRSISSDQTDAFTDTHTAQRYATRLAYSITMNESDRELPLCMLPGKEYVLNIENQNKYMIVDLRDC